LDYTFFPPSATVPSKYSLSVKVTYTPKAGAVAGPFTDMIRVETPCGEVTCIITGLLVNPNVDVQTIEIKFDDITICDSTE
jgi:hypothetical protein